LGCVHGSGWLRCTCHEGWEGPRCDIFAGYTSGDFHLREIKNDEVEFELPYAQSGSHMRAELEGIFWMDQRSVNVEGMAEAGYDSYFGASAADEFLVSFGEATFDPQTRCVSPVPTYGPSWTYMNDGNGTNEQWATNFGNRLTGFFCFIDDSYTTIEVVSKMYLSLGPFWLWVTIPNWVTARMLMKKTSFGFDRVTEWGAFAKTMGRVYGLPKSDFQDWHYPVFQIVDGNGNRTPHYAAYLAWANSDTTATVSTYEVPVNRGNGTQLVGVRASM